MNGNILNLGLLVAALELFSACAPLPPPIERQSSGAFSGSWENFTYGRREALMVDANLREDDKPIHLQVILIKPNGDGPFPLAVFNHGSTGRGTDPSLFSQTWYNAVLAEFFVKKGWVVAFPQRRGRGKSNGLYDEGFGWNRSAGYSCNPNDSLLGAERALTDIQAAIAALKRRGDIDPKRVL